MNILSSIQQADLPKVTFHERKISIDTNYTILKGGFKVGKSYLIYDYLSKFSNEEFLYIDCDDYKNDMNEITLYLNTFLQETSIEVLVIENFDFSFELPKLSSIILSTNLNNELEEFQTLLVEPFDFEEFLLFDSKHQNVDQSFNSFLKFGNFPEIIEYSEQKRSKRNYEICQLFCKDATEFEILMLLIKNSAELKSIYQLYTTLKKTHKISKDRFYDTCTRYEKNHIIFFISKFDQEKAVKKLFIFNHALIDIVSYKKSFNNLFKNMIFLELRRHYSDIYYLDYIDFYIPSQNQIILAIPFFNPTTLENKKTKLLKKIEKYNIKEFTIITVNSEQTFNLGKIEVQVLSFTNWALSL